LKITRGKSEIAVWEMVTRKSEILVLKLLLENPKLRLEKGNGYSKTRNNSLKAARGKPEMITRKPEIMV